MIGLRAPAVSHLSGRQHRDKFRSTVWPAEIIETIRRKVAAGMSASTIAGHLTSSSGSKVTRSAVLGLIQRRKGQPGWPAHDRRGEDHIAPRAIRKAVEKDFVTKTTPEGAAYDAASLRLPLADVDARGCRFPINDAPTAAGILFCGHPIHAKRYCEHHHARAYRCAEAE